MHKKSLLKTVVVSNMNTVAVCFKQLTKFKELNSDYFLINEVQVCYNLMICIFHFRYL